MKGGEWILYLEEEKKMIKDLVKGKEEKVEYLNVEIIKEKKYILGGMMREKVWKYMWKWKRIKEEMMEEN